MSPNMLAELEEQQIELRRTIQELQRMVEQYRTLEKNSPDCVFIVNRDFTIRYINGSAARFLKKDALEITGKPLRFFFASETYQSLVRHLEHVFGSGMAVTSEECVSFPDIELFLNTKWVPIKEISGAISAVLFISREIASECSHGLREQGNAGQSPYMLSKREAQVLDLIAEGLTNKEIGHALFISPKTVDTHRTRIMKKLNAHNAAELIRRSRQTGLID